MHEKVAAQAGELQVEREQTAKLRAQIETYRAEAETLRKNLAGANAGTPEGLVAAKSAAASQQSAGADGGGASGEGGGGGFMKSVAKMFKDPEMKKVMRSQQSMGVRMMYGDLAKELGLSGEEANQVMELLTERQLAIAGKSMEMLDGSDGDPARLEKSGEEVAASRDDYDAQIKGLIGEEKMKKLEEFDRTIGERMQLSQLQQALSASGVALDDTQRQALLGIMKEERLKMPPSVFDAGSKDVAGQMRAMQSDTALDEMLQRTGTFNERVRTRARGLISPEQMSALETAQQQHLEMIKMGMKMSKEMFKSGGK